MNPVKLSDIAEALDTNLMEGGYYLDEATGETLLIDDEALGFLEENQDFLASHLTDKEAIERLMDEENLSSWQLGTIMEAAGSYGVSLCWVEPLSSREQYTIMENYIETVQDEKIRGLLFVTIEGPGAFRRFKDALSTIDLLNDYFEYHGRAITEKAREWCRDRNYPFTEAEETATSATNR